jgi:group I intron endonuclease
MINTCTMCVKETNSDGIVHYAILPAVGQRNREVYCGIYAIENILNGDCYFGHSVDIYGRWYGHLEGINNNTHDNIHLMRAFHKYGYDAFVFRIVLLCEEFELVYYEQACVDYLNSSYNMCRVCVKSRKGLKASNETRKKLSKARIGNKNSLGRTCSEDHKRRMSARLIGNQYTKGHKLSDEHKLHMSLTLKGKPHTAEHTQHAAAARVGSKRSEESKRRMSESAKKRKRFPLSEEHKKKLSEALIGNTRFAGHVPWNKGLETSEETALKISKANKGQKRSEETKRRISEGLLKHYRGKK